MLIKCSLCTALSRKEEKCIIIKGYSSSHPDFDKSGNPPNPANVTAFKRYNPKCCNPNVVIYSMITGKKVNIKDSLENLNEFMDKCDIFNWKYLKSHYQ